MAGLRTWLRRQVVALLRPLVQELVGAYLEALCRQAQSPQAGPSAPLARPPDVAPLTLPELAFFSGRDACHDSMGGVWTRYGTTYIRMQ